MNSRTLSAQDVRDLLNYDPMTGEFTWKMKPTRWSDIGDIAGSLTDRGYIHIGICRKYYAAHRLAMVYMSGVWPENDVDHINGDRSDNRYCNLRVATRTQNAQNGKRHSNTASGYKGAYLHRKTGKWQSAIRVNGRQTYLGLFHTPQAAHIAYVEAAQKYFGEFARNE